MYYKVAVKVALIICTAAFLQARADAGVLQFGQANVQGNNITVPVVLQGDVGSGVSAMDFTLTYDPAVLEAVRVSTGSAANAADKDVQFNLIEPGQVKVVMMGLNQGVVSGGEVATVVMRRLSSDAASAELAVVDPTFADPNATAIPSQGSTETLDFSGKPQDDGTSSGEQQDPQDTGDQEATDGNGDTADGSTTPDADPATVTPTVPSADGSVDPADLSSTPTTSARSVPGGATTKPGNVPNRPIGPMANAVPPTPGSSPHLPQGIRPDRTAPGTDPAQPGTALARPETPNGTPGTTPPGVERRGPLAMATPGAMVPASPTGAVGNAAPAIPPATDAKAERGISLKWVGIGVIVLALLGLFVLRRRLFT